MQTFLPDPDFERSAWALDPKRLRNQRNECKALVKTITGESDPGWKNHPAAKQWWNHLEALIEYSLVICDECERRGYPSAQFNCSDGTIMRDVDWFLQYSVDEPYHLPWWVGYWPYHDSHRSNLIRKNPEHYSPLWPGVAPDLEYVWPSKLKEPDKVCVMTPITF